MKILHVNTYDQGGAAIAAIRLHQALLSEGVDSSILFLERAKKNIPNSYYYIDYAKINRRFFRRQINKLRKIIWPESEKKYLNRIKLKNRVEGFDSFSFNPSDPDISTQRICQQADIIHLHWTAGFVDYKTLKKIEKPVVWTLHDMNPFTGGCHYSNNCNKYKTDCFKCPQLMGTRNIDNAYIDQNYKKNFLSFVSPIITAPSVWLKNCSVQSSLFRRYETFHIPYSLDTSIFKPLNKVFCKNLLNLAEGKKTILFVSEVISNTRKGFDLLEDALKKVNIEELQLCAIGENNKANKINMDVKYLGTIFDERLMAIAYSAADAIVIPSLEDNLPNVMLESLSCGTPVIAFPVGGIKEIIKTGINGVLSSEINSDSLAVAIKEFLDNISLFNRCEISYEARNAFSPIKQANQYIKIYNKLIIGD